MKTEENSREILSERIKSTSNKYAAHSFYIVFTYLLISSVIKLYIFNINMVYWFDTFIIVMIASGYYTIRGIKFGIFLKRKNVKKTRYIFSVIVGSIIFGVLHFLGQMDKSLLNNLLESIIVAILWGIIFYFLMNWIVKKSEKSTEELTNDKKK